MKDHDVGIMSNRLWQERYNASLNLDSSEGPHYAIATTMKARINAETRIPLLYRAKFNNPRRSGRKHYFDWRSSTRRARTWPRACPRT